MLKTWIVTLVALFRAVPADAQVQLTQIVSRENAAFDGRCAVMTVGRDGRVYLSNQQSPGFVFRFRRDGSGKHRLEPIDDSAVVSRFESTGSNNLAALSTNNGLSPAENRRHFETPHIAEMTDLVLNGLRTIGGRV